MDEDTTTPHRSKVRTISIIAGLLVVAFLIGFVPQWLRGRSLQSELTVATHEVAMLDMGGRLAAALAESQRGNYERARQLMADFFKDLEAGMSGLEDPAQRQALNAIMSERDEIITQLSRAEPEATSRLNLMYTRYFAAVHPTGRQNPAAVTPSPATPPPAAEAPTAP